MTSNTYSRTIFIALLVCAGFAKADIAKCVDETGAVTYTNVSCPSGTKLARAASTSNPDTADATDSPAAGHIAADGPARDATWGKNGVSNLTVRSAGTDVATLKAARSSMLSMDRALLLSRQVKLARLN